MLYSHEPQKAYRGLRSGESLRRAVLLYYKTGNGEVYRRPVLQQRRCGRYNIKAGKICGNANGAFNGN